MFNKNKIEQLENQILLNKNNINKLKIKLSVANNNNELLRQENERLKNELKYADFEYLENQLATLKAQLKSIKDEIDFKHKELDNLNKDIINLDEKFTIQSLGLYDLPKDLQYYKNELENIRNKQKNMLKDKEYFKCLNQWIVNDNIKDGNQLAEYLAKISIKSFNLTCDNILDKLSISNLNNSKTKIINLFNNYNNTLEKNDLSLSNKYLELKLRELDYRYKATIKKQQDKDEERYRKELLKEQALADKQLEQERKQLENELLKLENQQLKEQNNELLNKSIQQVKDKLDINKFRYKNKKSGWVYIISNPSLGKDIFKIGISRRDIVDNRISELSGSNIPFKFKPNCIIWSNDCFKLEADLHREFAQYRVNKLKIHREFFKLPLEQIEKTVKEKYCCDAKFNYNIIDEDFIASGYNLSENFIENK